MLQKSTRGRWQKLKIDRIALNSFFYYCNFLKVVTLLLWKNSFLIEKYYKNGTCLFSASIQNIACWSLHCLLLRLKKTSPIFVIILNKIWIFCKKSKVTTFKKLLKWKKNSVWFDQYSAEKWKTKNSQFSIISQKNWVSECSPWLPRSAYLWIW